ncbi:hypothetical protein SCALIN_C38_0026 [Candidatus Scalindua japonica]|uniref:NIDO domain-containing protein n=1 Tax=Candidatus Scalindua japonica TaxID=1284222 RepID=A0A286U3E9_9BACT|nr:nidogen-like domain-containing protein [Candidatus Scalindua japonica]GAX62663.1 hypothetical protein SCALIN_C38_0026 [Candidatus Scalindua japonica]
MKSFYLLYCLILTFFINSSFSFGAEFSYDVSKYTQVSGNSIFIDNFNDDVEPPDGPSGASTYRTLFPFSANAESGGFLNLNGNDASSFTGDEDNVIGAELNDNTYFFNSGSGGTVECKFRFTNGINEGSGFQISILTLSTVVPGQSPVIAESAFFNLEKRLSGEIFATFGSLTNNLDVVISDSNITSLLNGITDVTLKLNIDNANVVTASLDIGSNGSIDVTMQGSHTLAFLSGEDYTGSFSGWMERAIRNGFNTYTLASNDDESTGEVQIGFTVNFFGLNFSSLFVNNNGNITFDSPLTTYTPFDLTTTGQQIIAPFFADVDTRNSSSVTYGTGTVGGHNAFGVNWENVGYYNQNADKLNSFQLVLIDRSDTGTGNFDIELNYDKIEWETGDASGGTGGLGGDSARSGYSNGTTNAGTFLELPGSAVNGALLDSNMVTGIIHNSNNSNLPGRYLFKVRNGVIECTFFVSPVSGSFDTGGGTGTVDITAPGGCDWTALSNDSWITITSGSSGSGNGEVLYSVSASTNARVGTMTIAEETFTVRVCTFSISPESGHFDTSGGTGTVDVTAPGGCDWTALSNDSWITITSGSNGSGNGTVAYSIEENTSSVSRTGTLTIAGQTFTVIQTENCTNGIDDDGDGDVDCADSDCFPPCAIKLTGTSPLYGVAVDFSNLCAVIKPIEIKMWAEFPGIVNNIVLLNLETALPAAPFNRNNIELIPEGVFNFKTGVVWHIRLIDPTTGEEFCTDSVIIPAEVP